MNTTRLIAVLALTCATVAYGQQTGTSDVDTSQNASEETQPVERAPEPAARAAEPSAPQLGIDWKRGHNDADARECLQLTANERIHRCAEKYRSHVVRAKLSKASEEKSKPVDAVKLETSKSLDLAKGEPQKEAGDAKAIAKTALPTKN